MSLLPEGATFEELVQDCFLAYRGSGLSLSPLDSELLSEWASSGIPFEIVARGIRRAAEKAAWWAGPGEPCLRSLRACRRQVQTEIRRHHWRALGQSAKDSSGRRVRPNNIQRKFRSALGVLSRSRPDLKQEVERWLRLMKETPDAFELGAGTDSFEARLLRALPFRERLAVLQEARGQIGQLAGRASIRARKTSRRFHRSIALRKKLGLPSFW